MKKFLKFLTTLSLAVVAFISLSACSPLGGVTVTFYDKQGNVYKTQTYSYGQTLQSMPASPAIITGFSFKGCGTSEDSEDVISIPYTVSHTALYAKYNLAEGMFTSQYNQTFVTGSSLDFDITAHKKMTYEILINDNNTTHNISKIWLCPIDGDSFVLKSMKVLDEYANELGDKNSANDTWEVPLDYTFATDNGKFVIVIEAIQQGDFHIQVS